MKGYILCMLCLIGLAGCGYREGVAVVEPAAFLAFGGNTAGATVTIDESTSFALTEGSGPAIKSASGEKERYLAGTHYRIVPGKHRIQVVKNGETVVDRELLLGDGITREITVP